MATDGIVLKNHSGEDVTYNDVEKVMFNTSDGGTQIYSKGDAVSNVPIELDFSAGVDQVITAPEGTLVKSAIIKMPENLLPENIVAGIEIAGVVGTKSGGGELDERLSDFSWRLDSENGIIYIVGVRYDDIYKRTGNYDVEIPDTLCGYSVVLSVEG